MILDFFEYAEEADDEIYAVHNESDEHQADERDLTVADAVSGPAFVSAEARDVWDAGWVWARYLVVPRDGGRRRAADNGGKVVVE